MIGRGREDQADLFAPSEKSIGENLAEHECRADLGRAAIVHAHDAFDG